MNKLIKKVPTDITNKIYSNVLSHILNSEEFTITRLDIKTKHYSQKQKKQLFSYYGFDICKVNKN